MSFRKQGKTNKRRFHEQVDGSEGKKKHLNLSLCEVESKSSSCGSKNSHIKLTNRKKEKDKGDNFFIVDKIVGHKICHGKSYFKVQWQGYSESEDSWEPEENLSNVLDLIEEFKSNKISDNKSEDNRSNNNINRSRNSGCYEYVPSNKVVAMKTKYFDDIRDGKIDLTKNDLYSRVKTRKRLHLDENLEKPAENAENISQDLIVEGSVEIVETIVKPEEVSSSFEKNKFYQANLFEMSAEFMKSGSFKKSQNTIASKSSSNDDISLFNYSISPNTNQSDEFAVQISPHLNTVVESTRQSVYTQTISLDFENKEFAQKEVTQTQASECNEVSIKPHIQKIIDKIDASFEKPCTEKSVTNETDLLNIYAKNIRQDFASCLNLPKIQAESDLISIDNFDDLKCSILMDKYHLLHNTLQNGASFDWNEKFLPEYLTPLQLAISKNRVNIVRLLLRYGAPPDFTDNTDNTETPLMLASSLGYVHAVKALLDHGAFTDYRIKTRTALYFAIENGRVDVVSMLLKFGTNFYRIAENLSSSSLINDMFMTNRLSNVVCVDLLALIRNYHMSFINSLNRTITRYFTKHFIKQICIIFPLQWVSVLEKQFNTDFLLDSSAMTNIDTPILLLVHGIQADYNVEFWLDNNCCCIESVFVNDTPQSSLSTSSFSTTLWPLNASINKLTVNFIDQKLLSSEEKQIRIAIVAVSIDCNRTTNNNRNLTSTFPQIAHSRNYHRNTD